MDKELKQKIAIVIIALLALVKFFVMPEIELQNELLAKINEVKKTNNKYEYLLSQEQKYKDFLIKSDEIEQKINKNLLTFRDQSAFLLETQKVIESAAQDTGIRVKRFIWFNGNDEPIVGNLYKKRIRLVLIGKTKDYIALHTWFKNNEPKFKLDSLSLNHGESTNTSLGYSDGTLIISAFYYKDAA